MELEGKFRNCELLGIEASSEIQAAARRVAEENKRLRLLLQQRGVPESEIDDYVGRSTDDVQVHTGPSTLDSLLSARKPCSGEKPGCGPLPSENSSVASSLIRRPISASTRPVPISNTCGQHSATSSSSVSVAPTTPEHQQADVPFNVNDFSRTSPEDTSGLPGSWSEPLDYGLGDEMNAETNSSSCTFATNIIRDMTTGLSADQVKAELGCAPNAECKVDNSRLFSVIDKYSGQQLGL